MGQKTASGVTVYLQEELGNARLYLARLTRCVTDGLQLIEKSSHRDHFFEVAGHLIDQAPECLASLQQSLSAVALAADRIDYEELKQDLPQNEVLELERVLEENRLRHVRRRGVPMTPRTTAKTLRELAAKTRKDEVPIRDLVALIRELENGRKTARSRESAADLFESAAETLEQAASGTMSSVKLASFLRTVVGDYIMAANLPNERAVQRALDELEVDAEAMMGQEVPAFIESGLKALRHQARKVKTLLGLRMASEDKQGARRGHDPVWIKARYPGTARDGTPFKKGDRVLYFPNDKTFLVGAKAEQEWRDYEATIADEAFYNHSASAEEKEGKFEKGKPADPTQNMSPEDKKKWDSHVDEDGSNIKASEVSDPVGLYLGREATTVSADGKEGKFEKGKPADPTQNMSPEDKKKWDSHVDEDGSNIKKASDDSIRIRGEGNNLTVERGYDDPQTMDRRGVLQFVSRELMSAPKTIVLTDEYSLGPHRSAAGPSFQAAILDKRGGPVVEGADSVRMWKLYGPTMIDGKRIRPVRMVESKDYGRGDNNGWGGADPWPGTGKEATVEVDRWKVTASSDLSPKELVAMHHLVHYKAGYRKEYFDENKLGEYGPDNEVIKSLVRKGYVKVRGKSVVPDAKKIRETLKEHERPEGFHLENAGTLFKRKTGGTRVAVTDITQVPEDKKEWAEQLKGHLEDFRRVAEALPVPYKQVRISNIGGAHNASLMMTLGLDPQEEWVNGILQNSYYANVSLGFERGRWVLEAFSGPAARRIRKYGTPDKGKMIQKLKALPTAMEAARPKTASEVDPWKV